MFAVARMSCPTDAHPFNYMVDLEEEWKRFDPDGHYVRRWLPVLSQLPAQFIHQPWKAPPEVLEEAGGEWAASIGWRSLPCFTVVLQLCVLQSVLKPGANFLSEA
jgi:deoxyribodipyrimidine photolyase